MAATAMSSSVEISSLLESLRTTSSQSPLIFDSVILLCIQGSYYVLSQKFLSRALPTLREMSKGDDGAGDHLVQRTASSAPRQGLSIGRLGGSTSDVETAPHTPSRLSLELSAGQSGTGGHLGSGSHLSVGTGVSANGERYNLAEDEDEDDADPYSPFRLGYRRNDRPQDVALESLLGLPSTRRQAESGSPRAANGDVRDGREDEEEDLDEDFDEDGASLYSFVGSPSPDPSSGAVTPITTSNASRSNRASGNDIPLLPLHSRGTSIPGSASGPGAEYGIPPNEAVSGQDDSLDVGKLGRKLKEVSIRTFPDPAPPITNTKKEKSQRIKVLRLFHGRGKRAAEKAMGNSRRDRKGQMRGLGWMARNLFSICFAESLTLLTLVMFHSIGVLHSRSRHALFSLSLHILLLLILFVVPLVQCLQLTYRARGPNLKSPATAGRRSFNPSKRFLLALAPFGLYIFVFTRIPPYVTTSLPQVAETNTTISRNRNGTAPARHKFGKLPSSVHLGDTNDITPSADPLLNDIEWSSQQELWEHGGWLEPSLGRVVVCGVIVLGLLTGFGAIRTAWMFYENGGLRSGRNITKDDVINAERSLYRVRHDMMAKREQLARLSETAASGGGPQDPSWLNRVLGKSWGGDREIANLRREIDGLAAMENQVAASLEAMKIRRLRQKFSRTFRGRIFNAIGLIFAVYCVARILMCLTSVFFPPLATNKVRDAPTGRVGHGNTNGDWISYLIALGIGQLPGVKDVTAWSRAISLILAGFLILSSLAQVLRTLSRILRLTSKSIGAGFLLLSLGQLMSTYVISLLIQMRSSLPPSLPEEMADPSLNSTLSSIPTSSVPSMASDPSLLASLPDFRVFGRLFDIMFLIAALGSGLWRWLSMKMSSVDEFGDVLHI